MNKGFDFWSQPGDEFQGGEFARQERQLAVMRAGGARLCFGGKGGSKAPAPDPNIGKAALKQAELGDKWYQFAQEQFAVGNERQKAIDAQAKTVADSQLASQAKAETWAQEDRQIAEQYRTKFDKQSDEDRATGLKYRDQFDQLGQDAAGEGKTYEGEFKKLGAEALADGIRYRDKFNAQADQQNQFAAGQQQRYQSTYQPIEERFAKEAQEWDSQERLDKMAAEARGSVLSSADMQRQQQQRDLASMGIDPRSGRYAKADSGLATATALQAAGAQNAARDQARTQAVGMRGEAINQGRSVQAMGQQAAGMGMQANSMGLGAATQGRSQQMQAQAAGQTAVQQGRSQQMQAQNLGLAASGVGNTAAQLGMSNQNAGYGGLGLGLNAGSAAMGTSLGAQQSWMANNAAMGQGFSGGMQGYSGSANTLSNLHSQNMQGWQAEQQASAANSAGLMSGIGSLAAVGMMFM